MFEEGESREGAQEGGDGNEWEEVKKEKMKIRKEGRRQGGSL